jgi:hypothetical protein
MARMIGTTRTTHTPGGRVHRLLGEHARKAARVVDARLALFDVSDWLRWFKDDATMAVELEILARGDRDPVALKMCRELAQRVSDLQPHARSLDALADRIEAGEDVVVAPWRVIEVLAERQGIEHCRIGDLETLDAPQWLLNMARSAPPSEDEDWPGVVVYADDSIAIDTQQRQCAW